MNTNKIEIDFKDKPQPPFDFPYTCFELSYRIQATLEALTTLADPWGTTDARSPWRIVAFHVLRELIHETQMCFTMEAGYGEGLRAILGTKHQVWLRDATGRVAFSPDTWVMNQTIPDSDIDRLNLELFRTQMIEFSQNLNRVGLFFLRMMEGLGKISPTTIHISPTGRANDWLPIAESAE